MKLSMLQMCKMAKDRHHIVLHITSQTSTKKNIFYILIRLRRSRQLTEVDNIWALQIYFASPIVALVLLAYPKTKKTLITPYQLKTFYYSL